MTTAAEVLGVKTVQFTNCIMGNNLNLRTIRGFARLDQLALISAADVFDQVENPYGTQREPNKVHASDALKYALESNDLPSETAPHAFPEIILNARDMSILSIFSLENSASEIDLSVLTSINEDMQVVNLAIHADQVELQEEDSSRDPAISRVDGNHRLLKVRSEMESGETEFPLVPFALFFGLSTDQERSLFRDINGTQKAMNTSHLDQIEDRLKGSSLLMTDQGRPLFMAMQLMEKDCAFFGKVSLGGSMKGFKREFGALPPIKLSALKGAVQQTLSLMRPIELDFVYDNDPENNPPNEGGVLMLVELLDRYWKAVANAYPEAWQDRKNFVILQAIGLNAFSRLAAEVISKAVDAGAGEQKDFDVVLKHVAQKVPMDREKYPGIAGLAGAKVLADKLTAALNDNVNITKVKQQLAGPASSPIDE